MIDAFAVPLLVSRASLGIDAIQSLGRREHLRRPRAAVALLVGMGILAIGAAALVGRLLPWPFSYGLPLFVQVFFFMALSATLARYTPLYPDHPSFAKADRTVIIERMKEWRARLLAVDLVGGAAALTLGLAALVVGFLDPSRPEASWLAASSLLLALGVGLFAHAATLVSRQPAQEYVRYAGAAATARVTSVQNLLYSQRTSIYDRARKYRLELEVLPLEGTPYTTTIEQLVRKRPSSMPRPGAVIPIRYIAGQPELVVALINPEDQRAMDDAGR